MVLIHVDEMQNISSPEVLSQLLIAFGDALVHEELESVPGGRQVAVALPIAVYLTGLPEFADMAGARQGATFARRFQTTILTPIGDEDLSAALQPFVTEGWPILTPQGTQSRIFLEPDAQRHIVELSQGEPFLFQLAGQQAWFAGVDGVITRDDVRAGWGEARVEVLAHVERILERLPGSERAFLQAMAELEPDQRTATSIAQRLGHASATPIGPSAQRLDTKRGIIVRGKPYSFRHRAVGAYLTSDWPDLE